MIALLVALAHAQAPTELPAGHPPVASDSTEPALPAGHPPVAAEPTAADPAPAAEPTAAEAPTGVDPTVIIGAPAGPPLTGEALRERTHAIAKKMRCPVCQGLSVADSHSESALAMKKEVEDLVAKGYDEEQILFYFEASYGEFIRFEPKFEGFNLLVWLAPVALLVGGGGWIAWSVRRKRETAPATSTTSTAAALPPAVDPALEPYLRRVREETR